MIDPKDLPELQEKFPLSEEDTVREAKAVAAKEELMRQITTLEDRITAAQREEEARRYQEAFDAGVRSVLYIRCMNHRAVPQYNHNESGGGECPVCAVEEKTRDLREALQLLHDETADYIRINHLGDAHQNVSMQKARDALARAKGH